MKEDKSGFTRYFKQYLSSAINLFPQFYTRASQLLRPLESLIALLNNSTTAYTTLSAGLTDILSDSVLWCSHRSTSYLWQFNIMFSYIKLIWHWAKRRFLLHWPIFIGRPTTQSRERILLKR